MKLTLRTILQLEHGLSSLDGYMKDGKAYPFELGGTVRRIIGKNLAKIKIETAALEKARNDLVRAMSTPENPNEVPKARANEFSTEWEKMLDDEEEIDLKFIKYEALNLDGDKPNPIPGSILAALDPILEE